MVSIISEQLSYIWLKKDVQVHVLTFFMNVFWQPKQECITNKFGKEQAEGKLNHALQRDFSISVLMTYNVELRVRTSLTQRLAM